MLLKTFIDDSEKTNKGYKLYFTKLEAISSNVSDFIIGLEATGENSHGYDVKQLDIFLKDEFVTQACKRRGDPSFT